MNGAALHVENVFLTEIRQLHVTELFPTRCENFEANVFSDNVLRVGSSVLIIRDINFAKECFGVCVGIGFGLLECKISRVYGSPVGKRRTRERDQRGKTEQFSSDVHRYRRSFSSEEKLHKPPEFGRVSATGIATAISSN